MRMLMQRAIIRYWWLAGVLLLVTASAAWAASVSVQMTLASGTPTAATAGAGTITTNGGQAFAWTADKDRVIVSNHPDSPATITVSINRATCGPADWDLALSPGQTASLHYGIHVTTLQLYATAAVTYRTNFTVTGW